MCEMMTDVGESWILTCQEPFRSRKGYSCFTTTAKGESIVIKGNTLKVKSGVTCLIKCRAEGEVGRENEIGVKTLDDFHSP